MPYPPAYTEIYPSTTEATDNGQMGWRPVTTAVEVTEEAHAPIINEPSEPPPYGNQRQHRSRNFIQFYFLL